MSTTVRLTIDDEMQARLTQVQSAYPGLKPTQIFRNAFFRFVETDPNVQNNGKLDDSEFAGLISEFKKNSPFKKKTEIGIKTSLSKSKVKTKLNK